MFGTILFIATIVLVIGGAVTLARDKTAEGILLIASGVLVGPVGMALFV